MFQNHEVKNLVIFWGIGALIFTLIATFLDPRAGILMLASFFFMGSLFFLFTKARYEKIAELSDQIDLVLHNEEYMLLDDSKEGELAILSSEVTKMTIRLREQNEALKKEKENLSDSLADIAHQLKTPLTSVNLMLSLFENSKDEREQKELLREAQELLVRMDWLITSLLKLSRLDAGIVEFQKEEVELKKLLFDAAKPLGISLDLHGIQLQMKADEKVKIRADAPWLMEAFLNIMKNCMESVGENGYIKVNVSDNPLFTEITIHDSGMGFRQEDIPTLFERFYRGKNQKTAGYGIGLALSHRILTEQGASILAKNHEEGGALFRIRFPK